MEQPAVSQFLHIAIDGPVGAGKSDISERLAAELGLTYLYTGAMYRALALVCVKEGVAFKDAPKVLSLLSRYTIDLDKPDNESRQAIKVLINGKDVTDDLFTPEMDRGSSDVSTIAQVRAYMVQRQQEMAKGKSVVMEGRDIGLRVLPDAHLKIYLTASPEERAKRRFLQFRNKEIDKSFEEVLDDTRKRDIQDTTREFDPLTKLPDHWELDTTGLSQTEVVQRIKDELKRRNLL
jgi:cytidylate kinase